MEFVNLTPHPVALHTPKGVLTIPSSGQYRLLEHDEPGGYIEGIPVLRRAYSAPSLPPPVPGKVYILSALCAQSAEFQALAAFRDDIYAPDTGTGGVVRDAQGRVTGTCRLVQLGGSGWLRAQS